MQIKIHSYITLAALLCALAASIFGIYVSICDLMALEKSGIFEAILIMIANIFMFGIAFYCTFSTIISIKKGSTFTEIITLDPRKNTKKKLQIFFLVLGAISLGLTIFLFLIFVDCIHNDVFPRALIMALVTFLFLLTILSFSFFAYPFVYHQNKKKISK